VVTQCHATGLRQMEICPHLADDVIRGCKRNDRFIVLRKDHAVEVARVLGVEQGTIHVVGAGYNEKLFHSQGRVESPRLKLIYVGKLSEAKGLPWLLDAVEALVSKGIDLELNVAGSGAGNEANALLERFEKLGGVVVYHGQLSQPELASLMRSCSVLVLPSFYEGVPLVLVEAFACGCRLISTSLPGVLGELCPHLGDAVDLVPLPRLEGVDTPHPSDLPGFTRDLGTAIERNISKVSLETDGSAHQKCLDHFTWRSVFGRVEQVLLKVVKSQ